MIGYTSHLSNLTSFGKCQCRANTPSFATIMQQADNPMGHFYRGWGQFLYDSKLDVGENPAEFDEFGKLINTNKLMFSLHSNQLEELKYCI